VSECCLTPLQPIIDYIKTRTSYIRRDGDYVRFVLDQHTRLDFIVLLHW